nr:hypothetical protein [Chloroflexota bacterium]
GRLTISQGVEEYIVSVVAKWHSQQSGFHQDIYEEQMRSLAETQRQLTALLNLKLRDMIDDEDFNDKHNVSRTGLYCTTLRRGECTTPRLTVCTSRA